MEVVVALGRLLPLRPESWARLALAESTLFTWTSRVGIVLVAVV